MIKTENEKLQLILLSAPLFAELTMLVGFFIALVLLLFYAGVF